MSLDSEIKPEQEERCSQGQGPLLSQGHTGGLGISACSPGWGRPAGAPGMLGGKAEDKSSSVCEGSLGISKSTAGPSKPSAQVVKCISWESGRAPEQRHQATSAGCAEMISWSVPYLGYRNSHCEAWEGKPCLRLSRWKPFPHQWLPPQPITRSPRQTHHGVPRPWGAGAAGHRPGPCLFSHRL